MLRLLKKLILAWSILGFYFSYCQDQVMIRDMNPKETYLIEKTSRNLFRIVYKIASNNENIADFRIIQFDSLLIVNDTSKISLFGAYKILGASSSENYSGILLGSATNLDLVLHIMDNKTGTGTEYKIQTQTGWTPEIECSIVAIDDKFFLLSAGKEWELTALSSSGKVLWHRIFTGGNSTLGIDFLRVINNQIFMVLLYNFGEKDSKNELRVFDPTSGEETIVLALEKGPIRYTVDNILSYSETSVILTGRSFENMKKSESKPGQPYYAHLNTDNKSFLIRDLFGFNKTKVFWMGILESHDKDQNSYLIGETFTSDGAGSYAAKGVFTGMLLGGVAYVTWATLNFNQIMLLEFNSYKSGKAETIDVSQRTINSAGYKNPYRFAQFAYEQGKIHYFGNSHDNKIYIVDRTTLKKYNPIAKKMEVLGNFPYGNDPSVIFINDNYMIYVDYSKSKRELTLNRKKPISD